MGFLTMPVNLIKVITESASMNRKIENHPAKWYISKEGAAAYKKANTTAKKVVFFYNYLNTVCSAEYEKKDFLQRMAYILAISVDGSSKAYGSYPQILSREINPLIAFTMDHAPLSMAAKIEFAEERELELTDVMDYEKQITIAKALAALHGEDDMNKFMPDTEKAYESLAKPEEDAELFFIERCLIFTLGEYGYSIDMGIGPFYYNS